MIQQSTELRSKIFEDLQNVAFCFHKLCVTFLTCLLFPSVDFLQEFLLKQVLVTMSGCPFFQVFFSS